MRFHRLNWIFPMLKADRASVTIPIDLETAGSRGEKEILKNIEILDKKNSAATDAERKKAKKLKLVFEAYSSDSVKLSLTTLFGRKCSFCESLLLGTQSGDVEHYRPKGTVFVEVNGAIQRKKGYYWLASKWTNLLSACADCNRPRTQLDYDGNYRVIGKASFFPIENELLRATSPETVKNETPLLLDPCVDDPEAHLQFTDDGGIEAKLINGQPSAKGIVTIRYCGLARLELLQMRSRHRRFVMAAIRNSVSALESGNDPGADLDDLVTMLTPTEPYVAYTRFLVKAHFGSYLHHLFKVL